MLFNLLILQMSTLLNTIKERRPLLSVYDLTELPDGHWLRHENSHTPKNNSASYAGWHCISSN